MPIFVRRAIESDAASLLAHRQSLMDETSFMLYEPGELQKTSDQERERIVRLNARATSVVLIAVDDRSIVGNLTAVGGEVRRLRHSATLALGVSRSHWGLGIGRQLLAEVIAWSERANLTRLELTVHTTNLRAINLYLSSGFEVEGVRRESLLLDEAYVDEYSMSRLSHA